MRNGLVEGVSLRAVLRESGAMAPEAAASVLAGTLLTLAVGHGDVRPENVLVDASGGLTVTGFGGPDPGFTPDEPTYLAPERLAGGPSTPAADVFAATAVFFECLTAEPPFRAATAEDLQALHEYTQIIVEFAPAELRALIQHGLAADPADRPETAHAFLEEVETTATAAYGADWQTRGRALLGGWATASATSDGAELAEPDAMPEPPPVGEPIDERLLEAGDAADEGEPISAAEPAEPVGVFDEADLNEGGTDEADTDDEATAESDDLLSAFDSASSSHEDSSGTADSAALDADDSTALDAEDNLVFTAEDNAARAVEDGAALDAEDDLVLAADDSPALDADDPSPEPDEVLAADDLLSAFDELAPHTEAAEEPSPEPEPEADPEPEPAAAPSTTLLLDSVSEETTKIVVPPAAAEPLLSPSTQADIDHDWVIPAKPTPQAPRSLSAYANSLPSLPRPAAEKPAEPVATSAPDDWFRPGAAEPVDRGPRPTRQTAFLNPDQESTTVAAGYDEDFDAPKPEDDLTDPGGPRRKTLVGAVTAAVLLVAGAAAVVLGGAGNSGPSPAAQSSSGGATSGSPSNPEATPDSPSGTDDPSSLQSFSGGAPSARHSTSHTSSRNTKPTGSGTGSSSHPSSPSATPTHTSASSSPSSTDSTSSSAPTSTSSSSDSSTPSHSSPSSGGHSSSPSGTPSH
ncbi:MAG: hypothetical protein HOW97_17780 [Catenulispora sp.]|nr:hypothetical protein [Catenulispora sp.]